jgi:cobalamin-dependent methionine synthase I
LLIIGERINGTRKRIGAAIRERDAGLIAQEARAQVQAGADRIDVNAGTSVADEVKDLVWLVDVVQGAVDVPLVLDSANPEALTAALKRHRGRPMVNSISGESARLTSLLPLLADSDALVVALAMDDAGMPTTVDDRLRIASAILTRTDEVGVARERVYVDPLIRPVSVDPVQAPAAAEAVARMSAELGGAGTVAGVSNISFGLPARNAVNRAFLAVLTMAGLTAAIIDPTEPGMVAAIRAGEALAGRDEFCLNYIAAARSGALAG